MRRTKRGAVILVIVPIVAACATVPRGAGAQRVTAVETVVPDSMPSSPFAMDAPDMQAASRIAGCYTVTLGPWSDPRTQGDTIPVPSRLDLLVEPHTRIYVGFRLVARRPGVSEQTERYPAAWSPIDADSLQIRAFGNGARSLFLFLRRQPDGELRGTARYFRDYLAHDSTTGRWLWETYPTATASLRPAKCESSGG
jgi:hypothetical protein